MRGFCDAWRPFAPSRYRKIREKQESAVAWLGLEYDAHDAVADASILVLIWRWVLGEREGMIGGES